MTLFSVLLEERYAQSLAFLDLFFGPDAGLYFSDVSLAEQVHTESRLSDTPSDG